MPTKVIECADGVLAIINEKGEVIIRGDIVEISDRVPELRGDVVKIRDNARSLHWKEAISTL